MTDIGAVFGTGGPVVILLSAIAWGWSAYRSWKSERQQVQTSAPKNAAEADSAVVSATKEVVSLVRAELTAASTQIGELRKENEDVRTKFREQGHLLALREAEKEQLTRENEQLHDQLRLAHQANQALIQGSTHPPPILSTEQPAELTQTNPNQQTSLESGETSE